MREFAVNTYKYGYEGADREAVDDLLLFAAGQDERSRWHTKFQREFEKNVRELERLGGNVGGELSDELDALRSSSQELAQRRREINESLGLVAKDYALARRSLASKVAKTVAAFSPRLALRADDNGIHARIELELAADDAIAWGLALLLDPSLPYGRDLRLCRLEGCGKFFLVYRPPTGRPRDRYCDPKHMQEAQDRGLSARVMKSRRTKQAARKPK